MSADKLNFLEATAKPNYFKFFGLEERYIYNSYPLIDEKQARKFLTDYVNVNQSTGIKTTNVDMNYWIVNICHLSNCTNYWIIAGNTQGCLLYNLNGYCLAGSNGWALDRRNGELTGSGGGVCPESYIQRTADLVKANGKLYVLSHNYAHDTKAMLRFKKLFDITLLEAKNLLNNHEYMFTGERLDLLPIQEFLATAELAFHIVLVTEIPKRIITVDKFFYSGGSLKYRLREFMQSEINKLNITL